jgi:hypothetical protein
MGLLPWNKGGFHLEQFQSFQTQRFSLRPSRLCVSLKSFLMRQPCRWKAFPVPRAPVDPVSTSGAS